MKVFGVDFTSRPRHRKPITAAVGNLVDRELSIESIEEIGTFEAFEDFLQRPGPWIAGFDFPFGLPRDAIEAFKWPLKWEDMVEHCAKMGRQKFEERLNRDRISRPTGNKYRTRKGDRLAGSSPAVRLHQVPVGKMFFEGAPRLARAGVHIPGVRAGDQNRIALEAYPGYMTLKMLKIASYKSDSRSKQTEQQLENRRKIVGSLRERNPLDIRLQASRRFLRSLIEEPTADRLDSVICAMQAAWGWSNRERNFGLPASMDPLEGWIATVDES